MNTKKIINLPDEKIHTVVLNFTDGHSFDSPYTKYDDPNRIVKTLSVNNILDVHSVLLDILNKNNNTEQIKRSDIYKNIFDIVKFTRFEQMIVNFECCASYDTQNNTSKHSSRCNFINPTGSVNTIDFIVFMLSQGSQVICADFALKSLIANWDESKFGIPCPLTNVGIIQGSLHVRFGINSLQECEFQQLRALGQLSTEDKKSENNIEVATSSMDMYAMSNTIVYAVVGGQHSSVSVLTVAIGIIEMVQVETNICPVETNICPVETNICPVETIVDALPKLLRQSSYQSINNRPCKIEEKLLELNPSNYTFSVAHGTDIEGIPIHAIIKLPKFSGTLLVSSLHFENLNRVKTDSKQIVQTAYTILGRQRSKQMQDELTDAELRTPELLRSISSAHVAEIAACSPLKNSNKKQCI